jgi:hypothetical protein
MIKDAESFARSNFAYKYQDFHVQGEKKLRYQKKGIPDIEVKQQKEMA